MADLSLLQEDLQEDADGSGVDDYSSESDVIIVPSALDFVSQDEMLTPLGRLDKYAASENVFNRYVHLLFSKVQVEGWLLVGQFQ
uniref:Uncharacterized protein n=1 Tax=Sus scrofa TaxID=9823 RepID=A0A8D1XUC5_PIG